MDKPAVLGRAVPVLNTGGDMDHVAGMEFPGFPAPLLIPASTGGTQQDLPAAAGGTMDVPVVPALGFK